MTVLAVLVVCWTLVVKSILYEREQARIQLLESEQRWQQLNGGKPD